jgi:hypothetical protein
LTGQQFLGAEASIPGKEWKGQWYQDGNIASEKPGRNELCNYSGFQNPFILSRIYCMVLGDHPNILSKCPSVLAHFREAP